MGNSKSEIQIKGTAISISEDLITVKAKGGYDTKTALEIRKVMLDVLNSIKGKINLLIDLNEAGKSSSEARVIWRELSGHEKTDKVACTGLHPMARILAGFVLRFKGNSKCRFFSSNEEAMRWFGQPSSINNLK